MIQSQQLSLFEERKKLQSAYNEDCLVKSFRYCEERP